MTLRTEQRDSWGLTDATDSQLELLRPLAAALAIAIRRFAKIALCLTLLSLLPWTAWAGVGGSISGTITDASGAAIAKAPVTLVNTGTGVRQSATTDGHGAYSFPVLPVGNYAIEVNQPGFKPYRHTGIVLDTNSALVVNIALQVGERTDAVTVSESSVHLETYSSQIGE